MWVNLQVLLSCILLIAVLADTLLNYWIIPMAELGHNAWLGYVLLFLLSEMMYIGFGITLCYCTHALMFIEAVELSGLAVVVDLLKLSFNINSVYTTLFTFIVPAWAGWLQTVYTFLEWKVKR